MQTVEVKPSTLKSLHLDHVSRLQQKYQQDIELLDDLRLFMRQRSVIEKVYAQSLCKLVQQSLLKRQSPAKSGTESSEPDVQSNKTLLDIWKTVLDETKSVAMVRLAAAETYNQKISEQCKQVRANRAQIAKLVFEEVNGLQKDLSLSLQEMNKSQKVYREEEHIAHDARVKAETLDNKIKSKSVGIFTSLAKLQQQSAKMAARVEACEVKSTAARNDYILHLKATNAQFQRYHAVDIPDLIQVLDGEYFDAWKYFLTLFTTTELSCGSAVTQSFDRVNSDVDKISQQHNMECFLKDNSALTEVLQYPFIPQDNDPISTISKDHQPEPDLEREAQKWAKKIARENHIIRKCTKTLNALREEKNKAINLSSEFIVGPTYASSEVSLEEERNKLQLAEIGKAKAEARIEALRAGGVEVDVWLNSANAEVIAEEEENTRSRTSSEPNVTRQLHLVKASSDHNLDVSPGDMKGCVFPVWCVAVYDYLAVNEDELTIQENENLEVLGEGDGDGWMRARNRHKVEGLIPSNYIRLWNPAMDSGIIDVNEENVDGTLMPYAVNNRAMNVIEPPKKKKVPTATLR